MADFGLSASSFSTGKALTDEEIQGYLNELPADLSQQRRSIIEQALHSVGKIPYYFGGKPSSSGYEGNSFYSMVQPDYKGRIFRGLDCSGWINWVYWSATGNQPSAYSTSTLSTVEGQLIEVHFAQAILLSAQEEKNPLVMSLFS